MGDRKNSLYLLRLLEEADYEIEEEVELVSLMD